MHKLLFLPALTLVSFSSVQHQKVDIKFGAGVVILQDFTRHGTNVDCTFLITNPKSPQLAASYQDYNFKAAIPNGQTFKPSQFKASSGAWSSTWKCSDWYDRLWHGTFQVRFNGIPGDTITRLSFAGNGEFTNIKIVQPQAATRLPGLSSMRQQTRISDTFYTYTALLHGCYSTGEGRASCLVSLLDEKPSGQQTPNSVAYNSVLVQLDNLTVKDGVTDVIIGTATFKSVLVK